jgi:hypothetical protein
MTLTQNLCESRSGKVLESIWFNPDKICRSGKRIKPKLTKHPEGYTPYMLSKVLPALSAPLSTIFQSFMSSGNIADSWKHSVITPIKNYLKITPEVTPFAFSLHNPTIIQEAIYLAFEFCMHGMGFPSRRQTLLLCRDSRGPSHRTTWRNTPGSA